MNFNYKELFLIPNLLSLFRTLLVIPVIYFIFDDIDGNKIVIIVLIVTMYVTDILDGFVARRFNQISETGKIVDPIADKLAVVSIFIVLFIKGLIPVWFFVLVILRDILILYFGAKLKNKTGLTLMSNMPGKIAVFGIGLVILLTIIKYELLNPYVSFLYYIVTLLIVYSSSLYFFRYKQTIGEQ